MKAFTVQQVNEYIAKKLRDDYNLRSLVVEGEISGFSRSGAHYYFTLKDAESMIKCAIWGSNASKIDMKLLENGKKITVVADISPYPKGGNYSLSVRHVEAAGEGALMAEFNRVKALLQEEGLFDSKYKIAIPKFPLRVGIVTSSSGAAIEDIKKIITSKNNLTDIIIFPTQVQGLGAAGSICENIETANLLNKSGLPIDTLIVGRGGGSPEDLMAFNDESVARAIFASEIPIISAVGHESDFSISDFVADLRAETPTAAADMAVMDTYQLKEDVLAYQDSLVQSAKLKIQSETILIDGRTDLLLSNIHNKIMISRNDIDKAVITLNENNPQNVFNKGYAAVLNNSGAVISDINDININDEYHIKIKNGTFRVNVTDKELS